MNKDQIIKALIERLNAVHSTINKATDSIYDIGFNNGNSSFYSELIGELAPTEILLQEIETQINVSNDFIVQEFCIAKDENERLQKENDYLTQAIRDIRSQLIDGGYAEDSGQILGIDSFLQGKKELRAYLVDARSHDELLTMPNEKFMELAEEEGKVYSLAGFAKAFNEEEINTFVDFIRIL